MASEQLTLNAPPESVEAAEHGVKEDFIRNLEDTRRRLGLSKAETRVIDWGCGTGNSVARLREMGYSAWGVDVAQRSLEQGRETFRSESWFTEDMLTRIGPDGKTHLPDGHFHFVMSQMVVEHVPDLSTMISEIARVTAPGGAGLHLFPARWHIFESHCQLPLVHWFPKNISRNYMAMLSIFFGVEPKQGWTKLRGRSISERANGYCEYINRDTHYRSTATVRKEFEKHGFTTRNVSNEHHRLRSIFKRFGLEGMLHWKITSRLIAWAVGTFAAAEILTYRQGASPK